MARGKYKGCELESPIYRQIIAEKARQPNNTHLLNVVDMVNDYNPKRGKYKICN
tara:strand:- start:1236 stop:1397 length:162 start_codon:yes stop_codon:yes gene_type:complete